MTTRKSKRKEKKQKVTKRSAQKFVPIFPVICLFRPVYYKKNGRLAEWTHKFTLCNLDTLQILQLWPCDQKHESYWLDKFIASKMEKEFKNSPLLKNLLYWKAANVHVGLNRHINQIKMFITQNFTLIIILNVTTLGSRLIKWVPNMHPIMLISLIYIMQHFNTSQFFDLKDTHL